MYKKAIIILALLLFMPFASAETTPLKMIFNYFGHSTITTSQAGSSNNTYVNNTYNNNTYYTTGSNTTDDILLNVIYPFVYNKTFIMWSEGIPWINITGEPNFQNDIGSDCGANNYAYGVADDGTLSCRADVDTQRGNTTLEIRAAIDNATIAQYINQTGANSSNFWDGLDVPLASWTTDLDTQRGNTTAEMIAAASNTTHDIWMVVDNSTFQKGTELDTQRGNSSAEMLAATNNTIDWRATRFYGALGCQFLTGNVTDICTIVSAGSPSWSSVTGKPNIVNITNTSCTGTNKVNGIDNQTGQVFCAADSTGTGESNASSNLYDNQSGHPYASLSGVPYGIWKYNYTTVPVTTSAIAMTTALTLPLGAGKTSLIECELFTYSRNATNTIQFNVTFLGTTTREVNNVRYYTSATAIAFANSTAASFLVSPTSGAGAVPTTWELYGYSTQTTAANLTIYIRAEIAGTPVGVNPYSWCRAIETTSTGGAK